MKIDAILKMEQTHTLISIKLCKICLGKYMMIKLKHLKKWDFIREEQSCKFNKSLKMNLIDFAS